MKNAKKKIYIMGYGDQGLEGYIMRYMREKKKRVDPVYTGQDKVNIGTKKK